MASLRLTRRLDRLVHQLPADEVVYTADLGLEYVVFNGPVADADRVTKSYLARVHFCTMCAGNGKDNVMLVCFLSFRGGSGGLGPGFVRVPLCSNYVMPHLVCKLVLRTTTSGICRERNAAACLSATQVTVEWLLGSFEEAWLVPSDGHEYIYRMITSMTPRNTVSCQMHGQIRVSPRILAICWYALEGVRPTRALPVPCPQPRILCCNLRG